MPKNRWKYHMTLDDGAVVYVDTSQKKTKIQKQKNTYIYKGVFPNINFDSRRRFPR